MRVASVEGGGEWGWSGDFPIDAMGDLFVKLRHRHSHKTQTHTQQPVLILQVQGDPRSRMWGEKGGVDLSLSVCGLLWCVKGECGGGAVVDRGDAGPSGPQVAALPHRQPHLLHTQVWRTSLPSYTLWSPPPSLSPLLDAMHIPHACVSPWCVDVGSARPLLPCPPPCRHRVLLVCPIPAPRPPPLPPSPCPRPLWVAMTSCRRTPPWPMRGTSPWEGKAHIT